MKEIQFDDLPTQIRQTFLKQQMHVILDMVEKAGLLLEFQDFIESQKDSFIKTLDELCTGFAKKHPEKFYVIPTEDRHNNIFICNTKE